MKKIVLILSLLSFSFFTIFAQKGESEYVNISLPSRNKTENSSTKVEKKDIDQLTSDVDQNVPELGKTYTNRFALVIGNEDYSSYQEGLDNESNVPFARKDALAFKLYAEKTLGIPSDNIIFLLDAKVVEMKRAVDKINLLSKSLNGEAELFFYYAGHGYPDEVSLEPFLIPVDVSGSDLQYAIKLNDVYDKLTEFPAKRITVFIDACFSGGARNAGLVSARAVKVKPKTKQLNGNIIVFTASSGNQSAMAYEEKQHGLFTYYLLSELKDKKGEVTYPELSNYITQQVAVKSIMVNSKEQNVQTIMSPQVGDEWKKWSFGK